MHAEAYAFVEATMAKREVKGLDVVEFGSYIVNDTIKPLFTGARSYIGVDARPGSGVDVARRAERYDAPDSADIVVCCETLEHAADVAGILAAAFRTLRSGGLFIITAAAPERQPHSMDGHLQIPAREHYANIAPDDLEAWLKATGFVRVKVTHHRERGDVYAVAHKSKAAAAVAEPDPPTTAEEEPNGQ